MPLIRATDIILAVALLLSQQRPTVPVPQPTPAPAGTAPVEKLGPNLFRVGTIQVDTAKRTATVKGTVNDVQALEFLANARGGMKAYESALTLDTDAINFNVALVLIGLDRRNAKPSQGHFDPKRVIGDPVSVAIEYKGSDGIERGGVEKLLYDKSAKAPIKPGEWVYTGSTFYPDGRYAADAEGVLIGFAHTPSSVIESAEGIALGRYGSIGMNPAIPAGTAVTLRITALGKPDAGLPR
jgi:hypothetical protein